MKKDEKYKYKRLTKRENEMSQNICKDYCCFYEDNEKCASHECLPNGSKGLGGYFIIKENKDEKYND